MRGNRLLIIIIAVVVLIVAAVVIGVVATRQGSTATTENGASGITGSVSVMAVWSGAEQAAFQKVIDEFNKTYPNVTVTYTSAGDQLPTVLSTAVQGGNPPDIAAVAQPGLMQGFVAQGVLKPLTFAQSSIDKYYAPDWIKLGTVDGKLYGIVFKGANKSTVWYNVQAFKDAGVVPPTTWDQLLADARTLKASGVPAYSIGGADGWTLTDLFENIYLRTAGPAMYDKLTLHQIPWTDPSVTTALRDMAQIVGDTGNVAGGTSGALQTDFPTSVTNVYTTPPKAAMVFEGDFVQGVITSSTKAQAGTGYDQFAFPSISGSAPAVVGGGDTIVMFKDTPAGEAFVRFLTTPQAAEVWARLGGFSSPNKGVDPGVYPDPIARATAVALADAQTFRFDMSDQTPAAFGGTVGQGEWKILQDFLRHPGDISGTQQALEQAAQAAYAK